MSGVGNYRRVKSLLKNNQLSEFYQQFIDQGVNDRSIHEISKQELKDVMYGKIGPTATIWTILENYKRSPQEFELHFIDNEPVPNTQSTDHGYCTGSSTQEIASVPMRNYWPIAKKIGLQRDVPQDLTSIGKEFVQQICNFSIA